MQKFTYVFYRILCGLFLAVFLVSGAFAASRVKQRVIRVGWFPYSGYQERDQHGRPQGYNYEYLKKISEYTGWTYEFIDTTFPEGERLLEKGELDLLGCIFKTDSREARYSFPDVDCGVAATTLFVVADSPLRFGQFSSFDGMQVGFCRATSTGSKLQKFARENNFSVTLKHYETEPELLSAVLRGEVDAGAAGSHLGGSTTRVIASFSAEPFYFITAKNNSDIVRELDSALNFIKFKNPYYDRDLAAKYNQAPLSDFISHLNRLPASYFVLAAAVLLVVIVGLLLVAVARAKSIKLIQKLLYYDNLTGLYNRQGFERRATEILSKAPANQFYAVVALDIDSFRLYNEINGNSAGDTLLQALAVVANTELSPDCEVAARLSADDFAFLMTAPDLKALRLRIQQGDKHFLEIIHGQNARVYYGIYIVEDRNKPIFSMYDRALTAISEERGRRGGCISEYNDSLYHDQLESSKLLAAAGAAFEAGEFIPFFQPKYDAVSEVIVGAEALVRWHRSDGTFIPPTRFIELFEKNGLIVRLDFTMLERVCSHLRRMAEEGASPVPVSVNFSRAHLFDPAFPDKVAAVVKKYAVPPALLEIELTETSFMLDPQNLNAAIERLHQRGFSVSIDDFGSGYSSLSILKEISADALKIDMNFVRGFEQGGRTGTILTAILRMAKWLRLPTVVEGVETWEQVDFLRSVGCDTIQGYYYSKPLPQAEWERLLGEAAPPPAAVRCGQLREGEMDALLGSNSVLSRLLSGLCAGFSIYEFADERLELLRSNDEYLRIFSVSSQTMDIYSCNALQKVFLPDRPHFVQCLRSAAESWQPIHTVFHRYSDAGVLLCLDATIFRLAGSDLSPILAIFFTDITGTARQELEKQSGAGPEDVLHQLICQSAQNEGQLEKLLNLVVDGIGKCICDERLTILYCSDFLSRLAGFPGMGHRARGLSGLDYLHPGDRARVSAELHAACSEAKSFPLHFRLQGPDRREVWLRATIFWTDGAPDAGSPTFYFACTDITQQVQMAARQESELQKYLAFFSLTQENFFEYDLDTQRLTVYTGSSPSGERALLPRTVELIPANRDRFFQVFDRQTGFVNTEMEFSSGNGQQRWYRISARGIYDEERRLRKIIGAYLDIHLDKLSELRHAEQQELLLHMARCDALTGLLNRAEVEAVVSRLLGESGFRNVCMAIDVDNFKLINDTCGHVEGDHVLLNIANALKASCRPQDAAGRLGGDEFLLVFRHVPENFSVSSRAESIISRINHCKSQPLGPFSVSASIGITDIRPSDRCFEDVYQRADQALYQAKRNGKNTFFVQ